MLQITTPQPSSLSRPGRRGRLISPSPGERLVIWGTVRCGCDRCKDVWLPGILHVQHVVEAVASMHARHDNGLASFATLGNLLLDLAAILLCKFDLAKLLWFLVCVHQET